MISCSRSDSRPRGRSTDEDPVTGPRGDQGPQPARAEAFYNGLLGIPIAARFPPLSMTFFTLGNHHDFAVAAVGDDALDAPANSPGLFHVAFKIGTRIDELREAKLQLEAAGLKVEAYDHEVSKSIYFNDPDGNSIELYVDASDVWKQRPEAVAQATPFDL